MATGAKSTETRNYTLTEYLLNSQSNFPHATGKFTRLLNALEIASKYVSSKVRAAGLLNFLGSEGTTNVQGELVKKLDVIANDAFITSLIRSKTTSLIISEENADPIFVENAGDYIVAMDPLDGSSNIDVNISIGSIFAIYHRSSERKGPFTVDDVLLPGAQLVAAGYTMYGSATMIVLCVKGLPVNAYTLDPSSGEFVLTHSDLKIPPKKAIYSVNEGNHRLWFEHVQKYVSELKTEAYSLRYVGSMVADVHRTLLYGGIFLYPADKSSKQGKLRLLYEANPMAMIIEAAGGLAYDGTHRLMDLQPKTIHDRTGVVLGSKEEVERFLKYLPPQ